VHCSTVESADVLQRAMEQNQKLLARLEMEHKSVAYVYKGLPRGGQKLVSMRVRINCYTVTVSQLDTRLCHIKLWSGWHLRFLADKNQSTSHSPPVGSRYTGPDSVNHL
jgi:hypothetical protein